MKKTLIIVGVALVAGLLGFGVYSRIQSSAAKPRQVQPPLVQLKNPVQMDFQQKLVYNGDVMPIEQANIFSRVSGNIEKMYENIGDFARAGQTLALIDTTLYAAQVRQNAALLDQAKATEFNAEATFKRSKQLFDQKLIAQQDLDNADAALRTAKAQVEAQQAALDNAQITLHYCWLTAPYAGFITKRLLDPGVYVVVSPVANSTLYTFQEMDKVKIYIYAQERDVPMLENIKEATVTLDAYKDKVFHGVVSRTSNSLDITTRTLTLEVDIDNPDYVIKPGMFATVTFIAATHPNALVIPVEAIQTDDQGAKSVFTVANGIAHKTSVTLGLQSNNLVEILSGLTPSDSVITIGQDQVKEGGLIRESQGQSLPKTSADTTHAS